jgi:lysozyme
VQGGIICATLLCGTIATFEGKVNTAYLDPVGIPTICYGHTATVKLGQSLSDDECKVLFREDAKEAIEAINKYVKVDISQHTAVALVSFIYNVGTNNFKNSTLLRKLNSGDLVGACNELTKWTYSGGKKLNGLVKRREEERRLCLL